MGVDSLIGLTIHIHSDVNEIKLTYHVKLLLARYKFITQLLNYLMFT